MVVGVWFGSQMFLPHLIASEFLYLSLSVNVHRLLILKVFFVDMQHDWSLIQHSNVIRLIWLSPDLDGSHRQWMCTVYSFWRGFVWDQPVFCSVTMLLAVSKAWGPLWKFSRVILTIILIGSAWVSDSPEPSIYLSCGIAPVSFYFFLLATKGHPQHQHTFDFKKCSLAQLSLVVIYLDWFKDLL